MCYVQMAMAAVAYVAAKKQGQAEKDQANYQEKVEQNNAKVAAYQMEETSKQGMKEAQIHLQKVAAIKGEQRASLAARGLNLDGGDAFSLLEDTQLMGEEDARTIKGNSDKQRWGFDVQRNNYEASAGLFKSQADSINPGMNGLIAGASTFASAGGMDSAKAWNKDRIATKTAGATR